MTLVQKLNSRFSPLFDKLPINPICYKISRLAFLWQHNQQEVKSVKHRIAYYIASAFAVLLVSNPTFAATSARIQVSATILPFVSFNATKHVTTYQVKSEDLKRGYIDLPNAITVNLRTNLNGGVPVIVDNWGVGKVLVKESGIGIFSDSSFTLNTVGFRPNTLISKNFDSRIVLPADAREGVYPLTISMSPAI
jgi:hypothetical protein